MNKMGTIIALIVLWGVLKPKRSKIDLKFNVELKKTTTRD